MKLTCAALLFVVAASCGCKDCGKKNDAAPDAVARLDDHHTLTVPVTVDNLTVWPVVTDKPLDLGEFLTLDEALLKSAAEVREVGGDAGQVENAPAQTAVEPAPQQARAPQTGEQTAEQTTEQTAQTLEGVPVQEFLQQAAQAGAMVNTLVIENKGDLPILVCAGTVVKGGNQDRQIGQDVVLKAHSTTPVDAFCVERGRWTSDREGQQTGGKFEVLEGMATAKVRAKGQYEKDQSGVWQEVATVTATALPVNMTAEDTSSSSFAVAFDRNAAASAEDLKRCEDAVKKHFAAHEEAVGFAYAINGKPVAVRTFAHQRLLDRQLDDFVRGMATEALLAKSDAPAKPAKAADVVDLVARISAAHEEVSETKGMNRNGVRVNDAGYNGSCYVEGKDGKLAPVTRDWTAK